MAEIDKQTEIIEDFELLLELRAAYEGRRRQMFDGILRELCDELINDYRAKIEDKVYRWTNATGVLRFYDKPPARSYIQAKMLYRDGFYEATIMVSRSIAEMICYDRLDGMAHPFGSVQQVEKKGFRDLIKWLAANDNRVTTAVFDNLNLLYDLGNKYVHPKSGQNPKEDSLKALNLIGHAVFEVYGVKSPEEMVGRTIRASYAEFPDICSGSNFLMTGFLSPEAAIRYRSRHEQS